MEIFEANRTEQIRRHNLVLCFKNKMFTDEEIAAMDMMDAECHKRAQASGKRRHHAEAQVVQLVGPLEPILLLGGESTHHALGRGHRHC